MNESELMRAPKPWVERVREADAKAEDIWHHALRAKGHYDAGPAAALLAIAAELRAARIAARPGGHE